MPLALSWGWGTMAFTMVQSLERPSVIDQMEGLMMRHSSLPLVDLSFVVFLLLHVQSCLDKKIACTFACNFCMRHDCILGWETFCAQEALVWHLSQWRRLRRRCCGHGTNHGHRKKVKCVSFVVLSMDSPCDCTIHVLQFNACSVIANLTEIKSQISQEQPQLILIQEDWLNDTFGCKIHDYNWIHCSCKIKHNSEKIWGGGVSILVKNDSLLSFERLSLPLHEDFATIDITAVQLYYQHPTRLTIINIANIYCLPTTSYIYTNCSPSFNPHSLLQLPLQTVGFA